MSGLSKRDLKIIISIVAISFIQGLQYGVSPVLNDIQAHYSDVDVSLVQMLITAPAIISIFAALTSGWLVTKVSKKKLLLLAAAVAGVTGLAPMLVDSFAFLFACRIVYGISLGLATSLNAVVVADFFTGEKRTQVMGIQAASIGVGMFLVSTIGGFLGGFGFRTSYLINLIGFMSFAALAVFLPDTGVVKRASGGKKKIELNGRVFALTIFGLLEFMFLITFTTNISMHLSGDIAGSSQAAGIITGVFSAAQIVMGIVLGAVTKVTKRFSLPVAMLSFSLGGVLLVLFPDNVALLTVGAVFCGFSQGMFVPTAYTEVTNAVDEASTAMASAVYTSGQNIGQLTSAFVMNGLAGFALGQTSTGNVYILASAGMLISAVACFMWKTTSKD